MKKNNTWMTVATLVLGIAALVLILVSIFNENSSNMVLTAGLACAVLGCLLNVVRFVQNRKPTNR